MMSSVAHIQEESSSQNKEVDKTLLFTEQVTRCVFVLMVWLETQPAAAQGPSVAWTMSARFT